jgi:tRNA G46 methylase TrmB
MSIDNGIYVRTNIASGITFDFGYSVATGNIATAYYQLGTAPDGFNYPISPKQVNWIDYYPNIKDGDRVIKILDIGMGFGGLSIALATIFPDTLILGMEIRAKVCEYVRQRIESLRLDNTGMFQNASCLRL